MTVSAETAYLFRHAIVRTAAYELQPPTDRAALHGLVVEILESFHEPIPSDLEHSDAVKTPHPLDRHAAELAEHCRLAAEYGRPDMDAKRELYLIRAGQFAWREYRLDDADSHWLALESVTSEHERRVRALHNLGTNAADRSRLTEAREYQLRAIDEAEKAVAAGLRNADQVRRFAMNARISLSYYDYRGGDTAGALTRARRVLEDSRTIGNAEIERKALRAQGWFLLRSGRRDDAIEAFEAALVIERQFDDPPHEGQLLGALGVALAEAGRFDEALERMDRGLELARRSNFERAETSLLGNKVVALRGLGRDEEAGDILRQVLANVRRTGDRAGEATAIGNIANLQADRGEHREAETGYIAAIQLSRESGERRAVCLWQGNLAVLRSRMGREAEAAEGLRQALAFAEALGDTLLAGAWRCWSAINAARMGRVEAAIDDWRRGTAELAAVSPGILGQMRADLRKHCPDATQAFGEGPGDAVT